jgi:hypothetical protein
VGLSEVWGLFCKSVGVPTGSPCGPCAGPARRSWFALRARVEAMLALGRVGHVAQAALVGRVGELGFPFSSELRNTFLI